MGIVVSLQERLLRRHYEDEAARHTKKWTATVSSGANIDVSLLVRDDDLVDVLSLRVQEHVSLVRSLSNDVLNHIERTSLGSIMEGRGNRETEKILSGLEGIDRNRAKLIARDQASKLNGAMNQFRQEQAGVTHYKWSTTLDGRERETHHANHGKTFAWAKPPPTGHPGHAINCRCRALPIIINDEANAAEFVASAELEGADIIAENGGLIRRVGDILGEQVLSLSRDVLLTKRAELREVQSILAALKGASDRVTEDLERMYARIYGNEAPKELPDGLLFSRTRATQLRMAISERLTIIDDLISHALRY